MAVEIPILGGNHNVNNNILVSGNETVSGNININGGPNNSIYATKTGGLNIVPIGIFTYNLSTNILLDIEGGINNEIAFNSIGAISLFIPPSISRSMLVDRL